jgi:hypothetical protein
VTGEVVDAPHPVDAPKPGGDAGNNCPPGCTTCNTTQKTCTINCQLTNCTNTVKCPPGYRCDIQCNVDNACRNGIDCQQAASCNIQVLVRHDDRRVIAIAGGGPGNRNDPIHDRGSLIERLCRLHRRVLADGGYRGIEELVTPVFRNRRIVRDATWKRHRKRRARVEHVIARLKGWRVLRDHRRRGRHLVATAQAVAYLHNTTIELRNNS